jgi:hypothetical protein
MPAFSTSDKATDQSAYDTAYDHTNNATFYYTIFAAIVLTDEAADSSAI